MPVWQGETAGISVDYTLESYLLESYLKPYAPVGMYILLVVLTGVAMLGFSQLLGPRRRKPTDLEPYECGMPLLGGARQRFSIKFYLVAILFVLFDIEAVFVIPWAVGYRELFAELGLFVLAEMLVFLAILVFGLVYAWKRGGLDWK
jgi:NADH-quinone oxidoreductase subunit A